MKKERLKKTYKPQKNLPDGWSPLERKTKSFLEQVKKILFSPLILLLVKLKVTGNMVSHFNAMIGITATIFLWYNIKVSAILLFISLAFDGVDGAVARASKEASLRGSFTDAFTDIITVIATTIGFIAVGLLNPIAGGIYLVSYPLVVFFTILRSMINKPVSYVLRPRIIVYAVFWFYVITSINILDYVAFPLAFILLFQFLRDFYFLRGEWHG